jgi:hypothetical protein
MDEQDLPCWMDLKDRGLDRQSVAVSLEDDAAELALDALVDEVGVADGPSAEVDMVGSDSWVPEKELR